ncbi:tail fiber assembly protein [Providencia sp. PROV117]|uniref:tail fiber assembly protein n=1 Tax=Providencia sp. PROV117 TaxID=2949828 RepID=UPI00234AEB50|nr:tail fiber assembly protein [Providencia sp. PROV117]
MIYFKRSNGDVFAYHKEDIEQVERLTELEKLIKEKEPGFLLIKEQLLKKTSYIDSMMQQREDLINNSDTLGDEIEQLDEKISIAKEDKSTLELEFDLISSEYMPLKMEYEYTLPVFFEIRENISAMKKMTAKEVELRTNPPKSKEQLITEAEQQKKSLLSEASTAIAPLQYAENLGIATAEESASLVDWQKYSVYLNRINTSLAPDIEWPQKP